jgi:hypothetical protein
MFGDPFNPTARAGIRSLPPVGLLGGEIQPPSLGPMAMQPPALNVPQPKLGWREKLMRGLFPGQGADDMLGPDEMRDARSQGLIGLGMGLLESSGHTTGPAPTMGQALARGMERGQQSFGNSVQSGLLVDEKKRALAATQLRNRVAQQFQFDPQAPLEQQVRTGRGMMMALLQAGDHEGAGKISEWLKSVEGSLRGNTDTTEWRNIGGHDVMYDKRTGQEIKRVPRTPNPRDPNAPDTAKQLRDQRMFAREQQLADDFNKDTTPTREMAQKVAGAVAEAERAKAGDGLAQVNMLYAFISAMDPGTAVREGEIGLVRASASLVQQAQGLVDRYLKGESITVPPAMVDQLANLMRRRLEGAQKYVKSRANYYRTRAKRWGVEADSFEELEVPNFGAGGSSTGNRLLNR